MTNGSSWRSLLSILLLVIAVIRLVVTCSKSDTAPTPLNDVLENNSRELIEASIRSAKMSQENSNDFLYHSYQSLDSLSEQQQRQNYVTKLSKDSLVTIDLSSKIVVEKNNFIQNNHDDTLRMAFKTPKDVTIFIHDLESTKGITDNFKALKKNCQLKIDKSTFNTKSFETLSYSISKENKKVNGFVLGFHKKEYWTFIEFESTKASKENLKEAAIQFLINNVKGK